jgi:hypothetical protein
MHTASYPACLLFVGALGSCTGGPKATLTPANLPPAAADCIAGPKDALLRGPEATLEETDSATRAWALEVSRLVHSRSGGFIACYERRLAEDSSVRGTGKLMFRVSRAGKVLRAGASVTDPEEGRLERCFAHVICTWSFPPNPNEGDQVFEQNISLTPADPIGIDGAA